MIVSLIASASATALSSWTFVNFEAMVTFSPVMVSSLWEIIISFANSALLTAVFNCS